MFKIELSMKKIYGFIIVLLSLHSFSQNDYSRYYNSWRLGLNLGGAWQTADYRSCWGMAGGLTIEKGLHENSTNIFSFSIRGRYLAANTFGMDYNRNYDVKTNDAYNGKYDPAVNFVDSVKSGKQYVYDNYKMTLGEGSLELQLTFNRLRERTHVLLNLWGGIGVTSYRTQSDLLDGNGKMYDFSLVDSTGNKTKALNSYNGLIDKKYESYSYGSRHGNLVTFSPSAGIGVGYQFSPGFSMLWEYKVTFPLGTNADLLDGKLSMNNDAIAGSNDYYHYTGLNLVFTLRGKHKTKATPPKDETVYTPTTIPTNTTSVPTTSIVPTSSVITNSQPTTTVSALPPKEPKPVISFITPPSNAFVLNNQYYKISAQVLNVASPNKIQFKFNGVAHSDFTYNAQTHLLEYNATLNSGNNSVQVIASNSAGTDNKFTSVVYEQPKAAGNLPVVSFINPVQPGMTLSVKTYTIKAQVLNVAVQKGISIYFNGLSTPFIFDASNKQVSFVTGLKDGSNTIRITANNQLGEDTKLSSIIFKENKPAAALPVITMNNPVNSPSISSATNYIFKASVINIANKSQVVVKVNGNVVPNFAFSAPNVICPAILIQGNNIFEVTATNNDGTDTKNAIVNYKLKVVAIPPVVNLIIPSSFLNASDNSLYNFKLSVLNVNSKADVEILFNGIFQQGFSYDPATKEVFFQAPLTIGDNYLSVKGTNQFGSDVKLVTVKYTPRVEIKLPPVVTISNPSGAAATTSDQDYTFIVNVSNMESSSGIEVKFNGNVSANFTYDGFNLSFPAALVEGNNMFEIKATNNDGTDKKSAVVKYTKRELALPPVITFVKPVNSSDITPNPNYVFKATINNMPNTSGMIVKYNGVAINNYIYDGTNFTYAVALSKGQNSLEITATNKVDNDVKTATVIFKPAVRPPSVVILQPTGTPTVNAAAYNFVFKAFNVDQSQIEVTLNGNAVTSFNFVKPEGRFTANLMEGPNTLKVKATNADGTFTKTSTVVYVIIKDTSGTTTPNGSTGSPGDPKDFITICHYPPGNTQNPQTLYVPLTAWPAHQAHGDTQGECPAKTDTLKVKMNSGSDSLKKPTITPRRPR